MLRSNKNKQIQKLSALLSKAFLSRTSNNITIQLSLCFRYVSRTADTPIRTLKGFVSLSKG